MKTSKRKRSSKSEPEAAALDVATVPAAEDSADLAVAAETPESVIEASAPAGELPLPESVGVHIPDAAETLAVQIPPAVHIPGALQIPAVATPAAETVGVQIPAVVAEAEPVIVLAANCSVKDAATLKTSLCAVAEEITAVTLDASAVERVDTATMQLLCAFVRDRSARNQSIVWRGKSQAMNDAVRLLGVHELLGFAQANGVAA